MLIEEEEQSEQNMYQEEFLRCKKEEVKQSLANTLSRGTVRTTQ